MKCNFIFFMSILVLSSSSPTQKNIFGLNSTAYDYLSILKLFPKLYTIINHTILKAPKGKDDVCRSKVCQDEALKVMKNMDSNVEPCDDFYKFACGKFINETRIPEDKDEVNSIFLLRDKVRKQLKNSIESINLSNEPLKTFKLVRSFYDACMNTAAIEKKGLGPLINTLNNLGGWPVLKGDSWNATGFLWIETLSQLKHLGFSFEYLIKVYVENQAINSRKRILVLDTPSFVLSRVHLINANNTLDHLKDDKVLNAYYTYMVDVAVMLGANRSRAESELRDVLLFEMKLAKITKLNSEHEVYNLMKTSEEFPTIPWKEFLNKLLSPTIHVDDNDIVAILNGKFTKELEKLLKTTAKRVLSNFIMWRTVEDSIKYLNEGIRNLQLKYRTVVHGISKNWDRWNECVQAVSVKLDLGVGALYVRKFFNENSKQTVNNIYNDIKNQFMITLKNVDWMDNKTRNNALEKLESMSANIAYPDELFEDKKLEEFYRNLELNRDNFFDNGLNISLFDADYSFNKLRKLRIKNDWVSIGSLSGIVNGHYRLIDNSIVLTAASLQGVFFNNDRPNYMNYGAIGSLIGHEMIHGFDNIGREFDKEGNLLDWWESSTNEKYENKTECLRHQYGNFTVKEIGRNLNGLATLNENIADNGGLKIAYLAYKDWISKHGEELRLPGLTKYNPKQMFWISAANTWCAVHKPEALHGYINDDDHSPPKFRVLGPLFNKKEFADDFGCPLGSNMRPNNTCSVW